MDTSQRAVPPIRELPAYYYRELDATSHNNPGGLWYAAYLANHETDGQTLPQQQRLAAQRVHAQAMRAWVVSSRLDQNDEALQFVIAQGVATPEQLSEAMDRDALAALRAVPRNMIKRAIDALSATNIHRGILPVPVPTFFIPFRWRDGHDYELIDIDEHDECEMSAGRCAACEQYASYLRYLGASMDKDREGLRQAIADMKETGVLKRL